MLQSKGFRRTFKHNLLLAILFAFAAGIVNVFGFVSFGTFTTNITGHIGEFALWFEQSKWTAVQKITLWIAAFGFGSFTSSVRSEEHTSELQSRPHLVCRLLLEKKKKKKKKHK